MKKKLQKSLSKLLIFFIFLFLISSSTVSAEQAAAEQYRQMFKNGNFYVEYKLTEFYPKINFNTPFESITKQLREQRVYESDQSGWGWLFGHKHEDNFKFIAGQNGKRIKSTLKSKFPAAMYQDGKYYRCWIDFSVKPKKNKYPQKMIVLSESEINNCLLEFVEKNKATKNIRIKRRKNQNQTRKNSFLKKEFRSKCMLSRKVMFSNIISLINNYESSNSVAYHSKYSIWESNEQRHTKTEYLYDKLEIKSYGTYTKFESLVDFCEVEEDELENSFIDEKLDTEINFFELKKELISLYDYCPILKKFMDNIEKVLLHKNNLSEDEINDIYLEIVNKYRQKIKRFG